MSTNHNHNNEKKSDSNGAYADGDLSVRDAEQLIKTHCSTTTIQMNALMIMFTLPLKIVSWDGNDGDGNKWFENKSIQLRMANCNHNIPDMRKMNELSNNLLGNPCGHKNTEGYRRTLSADMEFMFIYANMEKVCT